MTADADLCLGRSAAPPASKTVNDLRAEQRLQRVDERRAAGDGREAAAGLLGERAEFAGRLGLFGGRDAEADDVDGDLMVAHRRHHVVAALRDSAN